MSLSEIKQVSYHNAYEFLTRSGKKWRPGGCLLGAGYEHMGAALGIRAAQARRAGACLGTSAIEGRLGLGFPLDKGLFSVVIRVRFSVTRRDRYSRPCCAKGRVVVGLSASALRD